MEFLKDRYSIEEFSDSLSDGDPNRKKYIVSYLESEKAIEIFLALENLRTQRGYEDAKWKQALCLPILTRDEAMRYADSLSRVTPDSEPKKRGRHNSHDLVGKQIEMALTMLKGKPWSKSKLINFVAEKLDKSPGTLRRHYRKYFSSSNVRAKKT